MVDKYKLEGIIDKMKRSTNSLYCYSNLVADLELIPSQCNEINTKELYNEFFSIWNDMEIVNACALDEWEECGDPQNEKFTEIWSKKYQEEAVSLVNKMILFLKKINDC